MPAPGASHMPAGPADHTSQHIATLTKAILAVPGAVRPVPVSPLMRVQDMKRVRPALHYGAAPRGSRGGHVGIFRQCAILCTAPGPAKQRRRASDPPKIRRRGPGSDTTTPGSSGVKLVAMLATAGRQADSRPDSRRRVSGWPQHCGPRAHSQITTAAEPVPGVPGMQASEHPPLERLGRASAAFTAIGVNALSASRPSSGSSSSRAILQELIVAASFLLAAAPAHAAHRMGCRALVAYANTLRRHAVPPVRRPRSSRTGSGRRRSRRSGPPGAYIWLVGARAEPLAALVPPAKLQRRARSAGARHPRPLSAGPGTRSTRSTC